MTFWKKKTGTEIQPHAQPLRPCRPEPVDHRTMSVLLRDRAGDEITSIEDYIDRLEADEAHHAKTLEAIRAHLVEARECREVEFQRQERLAQIAAKRTGDATGGAEGKTLDELSGEKPEAVAAAVNAEAADMEQNPMPKPKRAKRKPADETDVMGAVPQAG